MKYLDSYKTGDQVSGIYFVKEKQDLVSKTNKPYQSIKLQDKTGVFDGKVWDVNNGGIREYEEGDYINVLGEMREFNGAPQISIVKIFVASEGEYDLSDYVKTSIYSPFDMEKRLYEIIDNISNPYLNKLLKAFYMEDEKIKNLLKSHSAAKSMHHAFVGGYLEHVLGVTSACIYISERYRNINKDLLITGGLLHDIGKTVELTPFPKNDYSDEGQLLGHITIGVEMIGEKIRTIKDFPKALEIELKHMILSHHGEYEFGSPKKPAIIEALALNLADNLDAKMEMFLEILGDGEIDKTKSPWLGYNKVFESYIKRTESE